jgi:hypothetical protein
VACNSSHSAVIFVTAAVFTITAVIRVRNFRSIIVTMMWVLVPGAVVSVGAAQQVIVVMGC